MNATMPLIRIKARRPSSTKTLHVLLLLGTCVLLFPGITLGRIIEDWKYERLLKESDLVAIATPRQTEPAKDEPPEHGWPLEFVAHNTTFKLNHVFKGKADGQEIKVLHFRFGGLRKVAQTQIVDGPLFVEASNQNQTLQREYLLFFKKLKDASVRTRFRVVSIQHCRCAGCLAHSIWYALLSWKPNNCLEADFE